MLTSENIVHVPEWSALFSCSAEVQKLVEQDNLDTYFENTRVYYNSFWISKEHVLRYINNVCVTHARRDVHMITKLDSSKLLNQKERVRARKHIVAMRSQIYAFGGCGPFPRTLLPENLRKKVLLLFSPTIDWDLPSLDAESFFILHHTNERIKRIRDKSVLLPLGQGYFFDENAYTCCIAEDILLLLMSAEEEQLRQKRQKKLWIKLPPLGFGPGVFSWNGIHIGPLLVRSFFWGVLLALKTYDWSRIGVLEIVDITRNFSLTPNWPNEINGVKIVCGRRQDILDFSLSQHQQDQEKDEQYDASVVCPGDVFAWPGNELHDSCLNSMIGNNTSMRRMGSPESNPNLQDEDIYVPIRVPSRQISFGSWPPRDYVQCE
jgi:hypothetical protein